MEIHHPNNGTSTISSGAVKFTIKDQKDNPINNAIITLNQSGKDNTIIKTSDTGVASLVNLDYGTYDISIIKDGFETLAETITTSKTSESFSYTLTVSTGSVNVSVKNTNNEPITGVNVILTDSNDSSLTYTNSSSGTGEAGGSTINVPYGTYNIEAIKTDFKTYNLSGFIVNTKNSPLNITLESS